MASLELLDVMLFKGSKEELVGVSFDPLGDDHGVGCRITSIAPDGEAERAGLRKWDKVLSIDGEALTEPVAAAELLRESEGECWLCVERAENAAEVEADIERRIIEGWLEGADALFSHEPADDVDARPQAVDEECESAGTSDSGATSAEDVDVDDGDDMPAWLQTAEAELQQLQTAEADDERTGDDRATHEAARLLLDGDAGPVDSVDDDIPQANAGGIYEKGGDQAFWWSQSWSKLLPLLSCGPWATTRDGPADGDEQQPHARSSNVSFSLVSVQYGDTTTMLL